MEALFKRYFWVVNLLALAAVAWLLAQTVVDYLASHYLVVQPAVSVVDASAQPTGELLYKAPVEGLAETLTDRNPFNLDPKADETPAKDPDCKPSCTGKSCGDDGCGGSCGECGDGEQCNGEGACEPKEEAPKECEMNVELVGTLVNPVNPSERWANLSMGGKTVMVSPGSELNDGKAEVVDVLPKMVYLREGNRLCHVGMWGPKKPKATNAKARIRGGRLGNLSRPKPGQSRPVRPIRTPNRGRNFDYSTGVKKLSAFEYEIDKQMLDEQLTDLTQLGMQARVIPNYRKGKYEGFKLVGVRPGSLYRAIGIRSGDIVRSINGKAINSPNKAMELFNQLKNSNAIELQVERRGKLETFNYNIR